MHIEEASRDSVCEVCELITYTPYTTRILTCTSRSCVKKTFKSHTERNLLKLHAKMDRKDVSPPIGSSCLRSSSNY